MSTFLKVVLVSFALALTGCGDTGSDAKKKIEEEAMKAKDAVAEKAGGMVDKVKEAVSIGSVETPSWSGLDNMVTSIPETMSAAPMAAEPMTKMSAAAGAAWEALENQVTSF